MLYLVQHTGESALCFDTTTCPRVLLVQAVLSRGNFVQDRPAVFPWLSRTTSVKLRCRDSLGIHRTVFFRQAPDGTPSGSPTRLGHPVQDGKGCSQVAKYRSGQLYSTLDLDEAASARSDIQHIWDENFALQSFSGASWGVQKRQ